MRNSYDHDSDTTPERQRQASPLSEPISPSAHSSPLPPPKPPPPMKKSPRYRINRDLPETQRQTQKPSQSNTSHVLTDGDDSRKGLNQKLWKNSSSFAYRIHDHDEMKLGHKLSETVKGKLSLGTRIIQEGGRANIFKQIFGICQGEKLLKASQCYFSTTVGPIPGLIFISTQKLAFCNERPITHPSPSAPNAAAVAGQLQLLRTHYKVQIPIRKIKTANQSEDVNKPPHKHIEIFTHDDFDSGLWDFCATIKPSEIFTRPFPSPTITTTRKCRQHISIVL